MVPAQIGATGPGKDIRDFKDIRNIKLITLLIELCYIRTKEKKEVDFCILRDGNPWMLIECKSRSTSLSNTLKIFSEKYPSTMAFQLTNENVDRVVPGTTIRIINAETFLSMFI